MASEYDDKKWCINLTTSDSNSFFHAIFGSVKTNEHYYTDDIAPIRRANWENFLSYYESRPRPILLKDALQNCFNDRGWNFDSNDFKEYLKYVGQDRQVVLAELPVLASLENVRIVLFEESQTPAKIIEPNVEILGNYPVANVRPLETAVILYTNSTYLKLSPQIQESIEDEPKEVAPKKFNKRHMGLASGIWYEINLLSIVLLNALEKSDNWRLSANDIRASNFDDLILEWGRDNSTFLLQAKWKTRKVYRADLFGNKYSGFSLAKYFFGYQKLKRAYKVDKVVLCTNTSIKFDVLERFVNTKSISQDNLLYFDGAASLCHTFSCEIVPVFLNKFRSYDGIGAEPNLITQENVIEFIRDFELISLYPNGKSLEQAIESKIVQMRLSEKYEATDHARHLNNKVMEWYDGKGEYLTPLVSKVMLCDFKSSKLLAKLHNLNLALKPDRRLFAVSRRITHIVPGNDATLNLLRVFKFLENEESKTLFLSTSGCVRDQIMMAEAFEYPNYSYLVVYKTEPELDVQEMGDIILRALKQCPWKKVLLVADRSDKLAQLLKAEDEDVFETLEDDVTFTDLTERSQEQLLERAISFYEDSM